MKAGDLAAEVSEVILADGELEHLVEEGDKVSQRANGAQRRSLGGAEEPAGGGQHQGVFHGLQGHSAGVPLGG